MKIIFPYFHIVSDEDVLHVKHLYAYKNIKQFKKDIQTLCRHYRPVSLNDVIEKRKNEREFVKNSFMLTFDDGFREIHDIIAPILIEEGVPATFFLVQSFLDNKEMFYGNKTSLLIELCKNNDKLKEKTESFLKSSEYFMTTVFDTLKSIDYHNRKILDTVAQQIGYDFAEYALCKKPYLTTDQVSNLLKMGFTVGGHSIDHPYYSNLSLSEQLHQTISSVQYLRDRHSLNYGVFAFPHSDAGVTKELFNQIFSSGIVDITFGTAGMTHSCIPQHLQRFSAEKPIWPIYMIIQKQKFRKIIRNLHARKST
ncbi:MAG: polysaccharide deacetylase family protein [Chitinispirillaceae bacterium]|nr:polysaccharide deacetylase family protein [Chitinispirillaceae bacterium]